MAKESKPQPRTKKKFVYDEQGLSWFTPKPFTDKEKYYFKLIESTFRVQYPSGKWDFIILQPHQRTFHSFDIAIKRGKAKNDVDIKSRNTSFTVDSIIRLLTGNYYYTDEDVPIVRINENKVKEIIKQIAGIIKHMRPVRMSDGSLFPFDPKKVKVSSMKIEFTDVGVTFIGYTSASPDSAENIRGLRTCRGLADETNFYPYWGSIWGAMKGASRGADKEGNVHFQATIGTTLRGETKFLQWFRDIEKKTISGDLEEYNIMRFPVFDPEVFDPEIAPIKQKDLIPIVFWHTLKKLNSDWVEDKDKFMEEYMAVIAPGADAYYDMIQVQEACKIEMMTLYKALEYSDEHFSKNSINILGIDPAGEGTDFFSVQCVNHDLITKKKTHFFSHNVQKVSDPIEAIQMCSMFYDTLKCKKCRIDGNDLGYFIGTGMRKKYGGYSVEVMRGSTKAKNGELVIPLKEYMHSNLRKDIMTGNISLIIDELIFEHFKVWRKDYSAERSREFGHGDSVIGIALANLPLNWRMGGKELPDMGVHDGEIHKTKEELESGKFYGSFKDRIGFYRRNK